MVPNLKNVFNFSPINQDVCFLVDLKNSCLNTMLAQSKGYFAQVKHSKGLRRKEYKGIALEWLSWLYFKTAPLMSTFYRPKVDLQPDRVVHSAYI